MRYSTFILAVLFTGCSDYTVSEITPYEAGADTGAPFTEDVPPEAEPEVEEDECIESSTAFDIEEVSALQDAFGLPRVRDGLTLSLGDDALDPGESWRPVNVQVLVMYPTWFFDHYDDSNRLTVHFHDAANPLGSPPLSVTTRIQKGDLDWEPLRLPADADWSGDDRDQMAAWLDFDLTEVVPETGFTDTQYFVSLEWDNQGYPNVGYSNFELNCAQNWTDYGNGQYVQNSGQDCSWPMFKIEIEILNPGDCEE